MGKSVRWNIKVSRQTDRAVSALLGADGKKRGGLSTFAEEAVRRRIFHQTVSGVRKAFADVPPEELQKMIDEPLQTSARNVTVIAPNDLRAAEWTNWRSMRA